MKSFIFKNLMIDPKILTSSHILMTILNLSLIELLYITYLSVLANKNMTNKFLDPVNLAQV